ncbi:MAG: exodeoxyribonuclease V subunit alpha [Myxococcota bacterium]
MSASTSNPRGRDTRREAAGSDPIERARRAGLLSPLDQHFANRLAALFGEPDPAVRWAAALACRQESLGHVCADLRRLAAEGIASDDGAATGEMPVLAAHASLEEWLAALAASPLVESIAATAATAPRAAAEAPPAAEARPLVLDAQGRLYLRRLQRAEAALASAVLRRVARPDLELLEFDAPAAIARVLADRRSPDDDAPARALAVGLARPLSILTGGPGTGKTTLVARLVRLLALHAFETRGRALRVRLLAPTGKAAAAMAGSFANERAHALADGPAGDSLRAALPTGAETIHRALARWGRTGAGGADPGLRIDADVVVVDEVSMVDLEQMARLFEACEAVPRIVLLGDPRQLASVEAGAVLADLCGEASGVAPIAGLERSIVRLTKSHRYAATGGIGSLAEAVREGDADRALEILADPRLADVERCEIGSLDQLAVQLAESVRSQQQTLASADSAQAKLARLTDHRVLCAHRQGPFGVESLARLLDEIAAAVRRTSSRQPEWPGRLLLITRNAPEQGLWNGDVGLVERLPEGLRALFPASDGGVRALSLARLPAHESAIAMSVHKSQGSEFEAVDLVLGARVSRLMTRELLYTGITRARTRLRLHASEAVVRAAIARRAGRDSGLVDRLRAG